ncbi:hypothetical protein BYT27DRAFT_7263373 [Phlegmacium glaucopus]|nr:hypothetical protein BYT27DRAFT_7263373 [Phlegmacium glaucopus]
MPVIFNVLEANQLLSRKAIFSHNIRLLSGSAARLVEVTGSLTQFEKLGVNKLLDQLGTVFNHRYDVSESEPSFNLDDPDETWFSDRLWEAAMKMEPLSITPTVKVG